MTKQIAFIVGSLKEESWNRKVAKTVATMLPEDFQANFIQIGDLPLYNEEYDPEENTPESYQRFREEIAKQDAVLFFTPEYNRSYPAAIKNAIDIASRPMGKNLWNGMPAAIASASIGATGAMGANFALRQVFVNLNLLPLQSPEVYLSSVYKYFEDGEMVEDTKKFLQTFVDAFVAHVNKVLDK